MTSPLEAKLATAISTAADPEQRAIGVAEMACYLARTGSFAESERLRGELRRDFGDGRSPPVSILIMCIEALLLYYRELNSKARDWMLRANLLSKSFQQRRLAALTSAWMAHIDFNQNRFDLMADELKSCATFIDADDGAAECRAALVLGDAFLFAGDPEGSKVWYEKARLLATLLGDHSAIGALTYNRAALRVSAARFSNLSHPIAVEDVALMSAEVNSAINYQAAAQLKSLDHLLNTAKAGVLMLAGQYEQAKAEIEKIITSADLALASSPGKLLRADLAFIDARSGPSADAREWALAAEDSAADMMADDRALLLFTASAVAEMQDMHELQARLVSGAERAVEEHVAAMQRLLAGIATFKDGRFASASSVESSSPS